MIIDFEQHPEYFRFASRVLEVEYQYGDDCKALACLNEDGSIAAVAIFTNFHEHDLEISIASDGERKWLNRRFLKAVFGYPFRMLQLRRVTGIVEEDNIKALDMDRRLGFVEEGRLRKWFGDKDGIVFGMLADECKWLKGK